MREKQHQFANKEAQNFYELAFAPLREVTIEMYTDIFDKIGVNPEGWKAKTLKTLRSRLAHEIAITRNYARSNEHSTKYDDLEDIKSISNGELLKMHEQSGIEVRDRLLGLPNDTLLGEMRWLNVHEGVHQGINIAIMHRLGIKIPGPKLSAIWGKDCLSDFSED